MKIPNHISESLETIFGLKTLISLMRIRDQESFWPWTRDPRWEKFVSRVRDKHAGSATVVKSNTAVLCSFSFTTLLLAPLRVAPNRHTPIMLIQLISNKHTSFLTIVPTCVCENLVLVILNPYTSEIQFISYNCPVSSTVPYLKSAGGLSMSTVVILSAMVFSSASRYRSMKYSYKQLIVKNSHL